MVYDLAKGGLIYKHNRWLHPISRSVNDEKLTMGDLAELVLMNPPTLTKLVDRMVADGLVHRKIAKSIWELRLWGGSASTRFEQRRAKKKSRSPARSARNAPTYSRTFSLNSAAPRCTAKRDHELILQAYQQGRSAAEISQFLGIEIALVQSVIDEHN